jgi:hypothetical protein
MVANCHIRHHSNCCKKNALWNAGALLMTKTHATPKGKLTLYISTVSIPEIDGLTFHCHSTIASEQARANVAFVGVPPVPIRLVEGHATL